ncbi:IS66 family transposase [Clostridium autoethanogenum]|uniref:IS66 family transposase n=1 Tax=Clostridium autoethanogenum TaxID=84023 RepID=A0A3M0SV12_9CLOT|nr:IS66 family transposase [Clostridium autoethanogenum]RMD01685.1 IS66 family transposase [Clostridium autoethanogenum]
MYTKNEILELKNRIIQLEKENKTLHETVEFLTHKLFGRSSEKTSVIAGQINLFNEVETESKPSAPEPTLQEVANYRRKKFNGQRAELLKDIPHDTIICGLEEDERFCEKCGTSLVSIGKEFIRTELEFIPAKVRVIDYYRESYECRKCRKEGLPYIEKSPMPYPVVQHSMASPSTVAHIMYEKFVDALPLYRQEKEWESLGVKLSRATMSNWIMVAARDWLIPLTKLMHQKLIEEKYLHADETPVQVLMEPGRKNTSESYMWVYSTYAGSQTPIRLFDYKPSRSGNCPQKFLKGFKGYLHTDCYSGYNKVPEVIRCLCWTHLRRYFVEALPKDIKSPEATLPAIGIDFCNKLFSEEKLLVNLTPDERKMKRLETEKPILEAFWRWANSIKQSCLPKSRLGKAVDYAVKNKEGFMNYLIDGNCAISNNLSENSIRPFTIGRKNWLFSGSPRGAEASAAVYSIIETAKANDLEPYSYLKFLFKNLPGVQFEAHPEFLDEYLPWDQWVQSSCKKKA